MWVSIHAYESCVHDATPQRFEPTSNSPRHLSRQPSNECVATSRCHQRLHNRAVLLRQCLLATGTHARLSHASHQTADMMLTMLWSSASCRVRCSSIECLASSLPSAPLHRAKPEPLLALIRVIRDSLSRKFRFFLWRRIPIKATAAFDHVCAVDCAWCVCGRQWRGSLDAMDLTRVRNRCQMRGNKRVREGDVDAR